MYSPDDDILDVSKFSFTGDFETQLKELFTRVRLTRYEVENLQCLIDDLTEVLSYIFPGCQVFMFGSIVTGLGIKTSDIDCFVRIKPCFLKARINPIVQSKNILRRYPDKFAELFAILAAKVPILKFLHIPTRFQCDVNFTSFAGVKNSQLIAFLLNLDHRALDLAIIIKYWSKVLRFTGTNLMANYSLTIMVIFYLQMMSILPSVEELQRHVPCHMTDNWNTAYDNSIVYAMNNEDSLYELLGGFFEYYSNFDYQHDIISPYLGVPVSKQEFESLQTVPKEFHIYKDNVSKKICKPIRLESCLCIQDPFDHSRNCSVALFERLFNKILGYFKVALDKFNGSEKNQFLGKLLNMTAPLIDQQISPRPQFRNKNKVHKKKQNVIMRHKTRNFKHQFRKGNRFNKPQFL